MNGYVQYQLETIAAQVQLAIYGLSGYRRSQNLTGDSDVLLATILHLDNVISQLNTLEKEAQLQVKLAMLTINGKLISVYIK